MSYGPAFPPIFRALFHPRTLRQFAAEHRCENKGAPGVIACTCHTLAKVAYWEAPKRSAKAELTAQSKRLAGQPAFAAEVLPVDVPEAIPTPMPLRRVA